MAGILEGQKLRESTGNEKPFMTTTENDTATETLSELAARVSETHKKRYGRSPEFIVAAPGRVNLIGEHIDYNDGFVLPMAIERYVVMAGSRPDDADEAQSQYHSISMDSSAHLTSTDSPGSNPSAPGWACYVQGVLAGFQKPGRETPVLNVSFDSTVPLGGGLSSSAALEVATATLLEAATSTTLDMREKALICQKAEHDYAGVPCGIMDQFSSVFGKSGELMLLDCRSQEITAVPFGSDDITLLITNSNVKHELNGGEYAERRSQCDSALKKIGKSTWRDISIDDVEAARDQLSEPEYKRARHVVGEIERTTQAADAISAGRWEEVGELMYASHDSLSDDFEVSCDELDLLVDLARGINSEGGVIGSRMTGGGFGGCTVTLVKKDSAPALIDALITRYKAETGVEPSCFTSRPALGAHILPTS
ncbi:galactokinase [Rhodopirellula sp. SWK7]|uniref:galactokinase n=1 Tax=Rhodopirellula sp. SWK7 TaxID=595460 RepID=UPI0002C01A62|nr:galactokinase [Rhodopirellula sp. SWK7]EMI44190.1 Galactokinase [Rhodopirellula sp. SWK7]